MERIDSSKPLIDFSSPVSKHTLTPPLIPVPKAVDQVPGSPTSNNPFDIVVKQTLPSDPFESVFQSAFQDLNNDKRTCLESDKLRNSLNSENVKLNIISEGRTPSIEIKDKTYNKCSPVNEYPVTRPTIKVSENSNVPSSFKDFQTSGDKHFDENTKTAVKHSPEPISVAECGNQSQSSVTDFSTEESLKAVIAKRVSKCIQKVLNDSLKFRVSKANDSLRHAEDEASKKHPLLTKRSNSFVATSNNSTKYYRLNKSCTDYMNDSSFAFIHQQSADSLDSSGISLQSAEVSKNEDCGELKPENDEVFKEANKLARTFSKIAESFCQHEGSDDEEDLISCKPRWLYADSSEDEEEKLRNDPALNIRVRHTNSQAQTSSQIESPALTAFKKNRRSLELPANNVLEEDMIQRSNSIGSKPVMNHLQKIAVIPSVPVVLSNSEGNQIKLKKSTRDTKRGPMKAVMPVQTMAKNVLLHEGKKSSWRETSPTRKQTIQLIDTPLKDISQTDMWPVASSTPNKPVNVSHLVAPGVDVKANKRHSLGNTVECRGRTAKVDEGGARQRSNSANSNIPTCVAPVKPMKGVPLMKSPSKPKSTSNLPRVSSVGAQVHSQQGKKATKAVKSSFNRRALNDMKPKSDHPGRVRSAVNTISNFVTGKNKKISAHDKENRVPV